MITAIYVKASWCGPCKVQHPRFVSECDKLDIPYKVLDADDDADSVEALGVRNVPFVIVKDGDTVISKGRAEDIIPLLYQYAENGGK